MIFWGTVVWEEIDRYLVSRIVTPWLPLGVLCLAKWQLVSPTPPMLGAISLVLGARLFAETSLSPTPRLLFCLGPILAGSFLYVGMMGGSNAAAWVTYVVAGIGTVAAAISQLRQRR